MRYWVREFVGWGLVVLGVLVFYACYDFLEHGRVVETGALTVIGIFLFRGGIHLLKMAVAARVCLEAQERMAQEGAGGGSFNAGAASASPYPLPGSGRNPGSRSPAVRGTPRRR